MATLALLTFGAGWISVVSCPAHHRTTLTTSMDLTFYMLAAPPPPEVTMKNVTRFRQMSLPNNTSLRTLKWTQIVFMHRGTDWQLQTTLKSFGPGGPLSWIRLGHFPAPDPGFCHLASRMRMTTRVHWASAFSRHRATVCTPVQSCYHARGRTWLPFILPPLLGIHLSAPSL